jgi:hypothetical protein
LLLLLLYTFLLVVKGIKSERKIKEKRKKKGVWIQAIVGRIRTPDTDPGHFGPDFDSGSGLESAFTDPGPGAALTHGLFGLFTDLPDFLDSVLYLKDMLRYVCEDEGNLRSIKIWVKRRKIVLPAPLLF